MKIFRYTRLNLLLLSALILQLYLSARTKLMLKNNKARASLETDTNGLDKPFEEEHYTWASLL